MNKPSSVDQDAFDTWLIDSAGNVAISRIGLGLLGRIKALLVPVFSSTEQAIDWGSQLNARQHATLLDIQRTLSNAARGERNPQRMVNLATQSQLMREAAQAFVPTLLLNGCSSLEQQVKC